MARPLPFRSVIVTGADGFVGRSLVAALAPRLAPDAALRLLVLQDGSAPEGAKRVKVDLRDAKQIDALVREASPDLIVHLAAQSSVAQAIGPRGTAETWAVNLGGSFNLARSCASSDFAGTFLFVSSADVYGGAFIDGPVDEASHPAPQSAYGRSKAAAEMMLGDVLPCDAQLIIVRPCNHSGPGQDDRFVLPSFAKQIAAIEQGLREPVLMVGNLELERDFLDVRDVVSAYMAILDAAGAMEKRVTLNVASGTPVSIAALLERMLGLSDSRIRVEPDPNRMRTNEIGRAAMNVDALRAVTGWQPSHSIENMLVDILNEARRYASNAQEHANRAR